MTDTTHHNAPEASPGEAPERADGSEQELLELAERLFDAARSGDTALITRYVQAGVPVNLTNSAGDSLLMLAAYHGHAELAGFLAGQGADVNTLNDRGQSPLAGAVFKGYEPVVRTLMAAGADPDAGNPSARATAAYFNRPELLALLG